MCAVVIFVVVRTSSHSYPALAVQRIQAVAAGLGDKAAVVRAMQEAALKKLRDVQSQQNEDRHKVRLITFVDGRWMDRRCVDRLYVP